MRIYLKLNFSNPIALSPDEVQDQLVFYFNDTELFFSTKLRKTLHESSRLLLKNIKKQMPDSDTTRNMVSTSESANDFLTYMLVGSILLNFAFPSAMVYMMMMIRTLQIMLHLPLINVILPGQVTEMFAIMISLVMFDLIESSDTTEKVFEFDNDT